MKIIFPIIAICIGLFSCNNAAKPTAATAEKDSIAAQQRFFPVTAYLKGEINNIKKAGINPLKYTTINNHTDSFWLKLEDLDAVVQEFLHPEIDSLNLITLFTEKSFLDQSIDAVTFSYDASAPLPDSMKLIHWDVYIDPETNNVKRVYMVKQISKTKTLQLTWINNEWCKIVSIITDKNGTSKVEKEEKLLWDF